MSDIIIYTDGSCLQNPGRGGWAAVVTMDGQRYELSGGARLSTNNRMELKATIEAVRSTPVDKKRHIKLYSDSQLVVNGIELGWARKWRANGWKRNKTDKAENPDLWAELLDEIEQRHVKFIWTKAHVGTVENERCDQLAKAAAESATDVDSAYENAKSGGKPMQAASLFSSAHAQAADRDGHSTPKAETFGSNSAGDQDFQVRFSAATRSMEIRHHQYGSIRIPLGDVARVVEKMKQALENS